MKISLIIRQEGSGDGGANISTTEELKKLSGVLGFPKELVSVLQKLINVNCSDLKAVVNWPLVGKVESGVYVYWESRGPSPCVRKLEIENFNFPDESIVNALNVVGKEMRELCLSLKRTEDWIRSQSQSIG